MAYLTVTTQYDVSVPGDGQLSLREAVEQANATAAADTIRFIAALEGQALVLTGGELQVSQDLTIDGDRNGDGVGVTIDGNQRSRILDIAGNETDVALKGLTLSNGYAGYLESGGGIRLGGGRLTLSASTIRDNRNGSYVPGAGIFASAGSRISVANSAITGNYTWNVGGAIAAEENVVILIRQSNISNNFAYYGGGAINLLSGGNLVIQDSTISNNIGNYAPGGAIRSKDSSIEISRSALYRNHSFDHGGGIDLNDGQISIQGSTVAENSTSGYVPARGGGINTSNATLSVFGSTITGNSAGGYY